MKKYVISHQMKDDDNEELFKVADLYDLYASVTYEDDLKIIEWVDITPLESNKIYSPLFDKTFDVMTPQEQKEQLDLWVEHGSIKEMTEPPFRKKLTKKEIKENYRKFIGKK